MWGAIGWFGWTLGCVSLYFDRMNASRLESALDAWRADLEPARVRTDQETLTACMQNAGAVERNIPAVLFPKSTEEVRKLVLTANRFQAPVHPISGGKNWGLGSRLPVRDGTVVVDLGGMNRIREFDVRHRYAVVEAGVTQRQLYERILGERAPLLLNVTGAPGDTSLVGNALERGVGYFASRADGLSGLEVVLGNGQVIRTGFGHFAGSRLTHLCRHGVGPSLDGLFVESCFGIVTAAGFDLIAAPEAHAVMISKIARPELLGDFIDALAALRRCGALNSVVHVGNRERTEIILAPLLLEQLHPGADGSDPALRRQMKERLAAEGFGPWSAVGALMGSRAQVREAKARVRAALKGFAKTIFLDDGTVALAKRLGRALNFIPWVRGREAMLAAVEPLYGLARGIPTDAAMKSVYWPVGETQQAGDQNPDHSHSGLLFCVPMLPADGAAARDAVARVESTYARYGFTPYITLNMVEDRFIETVINLAFDRNDPERVKAAHACNDELTAAFVRDGLIPYRVGVQSMGQVVDPADPFWQTVGELKKALDPNGIIAPGRYCP